jgi:hypothetical protein
MRNAYDTLEETGSRSCSVCSRFVPATAEGRIKAHTVKKNGKSFGSCSGAGKLALKPASDVRRSRLHRALDAVMDRKTAKDDLSETGSRLCPACNRYVAATPEGVIRQHNVPGKLGKFGGACRGSGKTARKAASDTALYEETPFRDARADFEVAPIPVEGMDARRK